MFNITKRAMAPGFTAALLSLPLAPAVQAEPTAAIHAQADGVLTVRSAYGFDETIVRIKRDLAAKGITFFLAVDQAQLAAGAKVELRPSTLLLFGNPALGTQFLASNPLSGLDWPVRVLVVQDAGGTVHAAYTDFAWMARRYGIGDRDPQFGMAAGVVKSVLSAIQN